MPTLISSLTILVYTCTWCMYNVQSISHNKRTMDITHLSQWLLCLPPFWPWSWWTPVWGCQLHLYCCPQTASQGDSGSASPTPQPVTQIDRQVTPYKFNICNHMNSDASIVQLISFQQYTRINKRGFYDNMSTINTWWYINLKNRFRPTNCIFSSLYHYTCT